MPSSRVPRPRSPVEQGVLREPLAAGSYSEYLAKANWDVRAHTVKSDGWPRAAACARNPRKSADFNGRIGEAGETLLAARRAKFSSERDAFLAAVAAPRGRTAGVVSRHAVRRPRHLPLHLLQQPSSFGQSLALGAAGAASDRQFAKAGVRTIVNLRGERDCGSYWLERRPARGTGSSWSIFRCARARRPRARS